MIPTFSIIIPTLNEEKFLPRLLQSLATQTYRSFEVIVIDGKSKDKTMALAKTFRDKLPKLTILEDVGPGVSLQRNTGASYAKGEWLVLIDADGECMPYFLERVLGFIQVKKPKLLTTWFSADGPRGDDALITLFYNAIIEGSIILKRPFTPGPLTIVPKTVFDGVGGYDETRTFSEDYDFGHKLFQQGIPLAVLRETLCVYSLRRFRAEGKLNMLQQYARASLPIIFMNRPIKSMAGYTPGGELERKKKKITPSTFTKFKKQLTALVKEVFE